MSPIRREEARREHWGMDGAKTVLVWRARRRYDRQCCTTPSVPAVQVTPTAVPYCCRLIREMHISDVIGVPSQPVREGRWFGRAMHCSRGTKLSDGWTGPGGPARSLVSRRLRSVNAAMGVCACVLLALAVRWLQFSGPSPSTPGGYGTCHRGRKRETRADTPRPS